MRRRGCAGISTPQPAPCRAASLQLGCSRGSPWVVPKGPLALLGKACGAARSTVTNFSIQSEICILSNLLSKVQVAGVNQPSASPAPPTRCQTRLPPFACVIRHVPSLMRSPSEPGLEEQRGKGLGCGGEGAANEQLQRKETDGGGTRCNGRFAKNCGFFLNPLGYAMASP